MKCKLEVINCLICELLQSGWDALTPSHLTTAQTPYKGRHRRGLLFQGSLSLLVGPRISGTCELRLFFPLLLLHLLLEKLHEAAVVGEHVGGRRLAPELCGAPRRGSGAVAARLSTAAAARLTCAVGSLYVHFFFVFLPPRTSSQKKHKRGLLEN